MSLSHLLNDQNEDEILAQVQEESLRHYREYELPRLPVKESTATTTDCIGDDFSHNVALKQGCSSKTDCDAEVLCTQVGGRAGTLLYDGEEAQGFHLASGSTYIYPTNFPIRQYQAAIVRSALFKNTLVGLPTGLGKTFIAAVVMYNFYRWFPLGKVVFMAPTRPLVAQQIKACYGVMGIPPEHTTEMTGVLSPDVRKNLWNEKRVFFLTPQVMMNDLRANVCPALSVKCIVIDEAHKATKDYAYCHVVKLLHGANGIYRTLALSATPGNDINAVIQVIRNLNISCLEMRGEESIDVMPYTHRKSIEQVVVDLSPELLRVKDEFMQVYERFARSLIENRALTSNIAFLSKFQILKAMEKFRANQPRGMSTTLFGSLVSDFAMCMTFAHALELLQIYGLRAFYRYLADESGEKSKATTTRLRNNEDIQRLLQKLHNVLYPKPGADVPYVWGHPKLKKLVSSLADHFEAAAKNEEKTKAIVFCQYKVVVNEIVELLGRCKPNIQAALFVGQSGGKERGMPQAKQLQIMKEFREGKINCLVATCVAEEGLDIGEVDLIVLMESQKSPVRLVQRLGRTGRKRKGQCIVLLTRGKEEGKFHEAMASRKAYVKNIIESKAVKNSLIQYSPPMFPPGVKPQQQLVHIKVVTVPSPCKTSKSSGKQVDIREHVVLEEKPFLDYSACEKLATTLEGLSLDFNTLPKKLEIWHRRNDEMMNVDELLNGDVNRLAAWNDWNTELHPSYVISHSTTSEMCCQLLSYNAHVDNAAYLKLIDDYNCNKKPLSSKNQVADKDPTESTIESNYKKNKKKTAPEKNYGMDIRSCMAAAVERRATKKMKMDLPESDEVIVIECEEDERQADGVGASDWNFREQLDVAGIFGMEPDEFENIIYGGQLLCGIEDDIGMCARLGKYLCQPHQAPPKPKLVDIDIFQLQCDKMLKEMDCKNVIPFPLIFEPTVDRRKLPVDAKTNEDFVSIDDLFSDDDAFNDIASNVEVANDPSPQAQRVSPRLEWKTPVSVAKLPGDRTAQKLTSEYRNIGDPACSQSTPNAVKTPNVMNTPICASNSLLTSNLSPADDLPKASTTKIYSSTPLNPVIKNAVEKERAPSEDLHWSLDDILEDDDEESNEKVKPPNPPIPPLSPVKLNQDIPSQASVTAEVKDDVWCLDDLFLDEGSNENVENVKNETSFYGVTQMVSQIEKDKAQKKGVLEEMSSGWKSAGTHGSSIANDCSKIHNLPHTLSSVKNTKIFPSTSKSDFSNLVRHSGFEKDAVYVIDSSDSCSNDSPQKQTFVCSQNERAESTFSNATIREQQSKSKSKSAEAEKSLLDEDDDIFCMLDSHNEKAGSNTESKMEADHISKPTNFKKFKKTSFLLSQLSSGADNDQPEEIEEIKKTVQAADLSGPSSKRKLSFDDFLSELGEGTKSKYFEQNASIATRPVTKPAPSFKLVKNVSSNEQDDDIFVRPAKERNLVVEKDERVATSSTSTYISGSRNNKKSKIAAKKKIRKVNAFIEREAEESGILSTDDSDNSTLDDMDDSFVNDESEEEQSYVHYLKSVKSPVAGGKFKIPEKRFHHENVLSQTVDVDNGYENDSFCVESDEDISVDEMTVLELAEKKLAKTSRKKTTDIDKSSEVESDEKVSPIKAVHALVVNRHKRRIASDSDTTPDQPKAKRNKLRIISPDITSPIESSKPPQPPPALQHKATLSNKGRPKDVIQINSDSDDDIREAIRLSVLESTQKIPEEDAFEKELQKALLLSQQNLSKPSTSSERVRPFAIEDAGTSFLFMSQPIPRLKDKKPFSMKTKPSKTKVKSTMKKPFEWEDSD